MDKNITSVLDAYNINTEEYVKLASIGGHKIYHLEGNALVHSFMVYIEMCKLLPFNKVMQKAALLHDIGKIYTSVKNGPNDWSYPRHSPFGAKKETLVKFIPENDPYFMDYQWLIHNHIKPLFWKKNGVNTDKDELIIHPNICTLDNLRKLAICDLRGSIPLDPKDTDATISYLQSLHF